MFQRIVNTLNISNTSWFQWDISTSDLDYTINTFCMAMYNENIDGDYKVQVRNGLMNTEKINPGCF